MFTYRKFDVIPTRDVDTEQLGWPEPGEADNKGSLGGNRLCGDMRGFSRTEARQAVGAAGFSGPLCGREPLGQPGDWEGSGGRFRLAARC